VATDALGDEAAKIDADDCQIFRAFAIVHRMETRGWMMRSLGLVKARLAMPHGLESESFGFELLDGLDEELPRQEGRVRALLDVDERLLTSYVESLGESALRSAAVECQMVIRRIQEGWTIRRS